MGLFSGLPLLGMVGFPFPGAVALTLTSSAEFVLLEQILPDGPAHPFAATMLSHFHKLNTQIKSVTTYPTVRDQHARFSARGWESVQVWTLWQAWADETFLSAAERRALEDVEPFDEWEEFALFATHYCVVHARTGRNAPVVPSPSLPSGAEIPAQSAAVQFDECPGTRGQRRFAAACELPGEDGKSSAVLNVLGLGTKSRLQSCDVFSSGAPESGASPAFREGGPTTRMCHSLADLGNDGVLLAGGRGSPSSPLKDCWLFDKSAKAWTRTHDLPTPLYRHSVAALGESGLALLAGGRGKAEAFEGCLLYSPEAGWVECELLGDKPAAVYGAVLSCVGGRAAGVFSGIYAGGLAHGLISDQILFWEADISDIKVCVFLLRLIEKARLTYEVTEAHYSIHPPENFWQHRRGYGSLVTNEIRRQLSPARGPAPATGRCG